MVAVLFFGVSASGNSVNTSRWNGVFYCNKNFDIDDDIVEYAAAAAWCRRLLLL